MIRAKSRNSHAPSNPYNQREMLMDFNQLIHSLDPNPEYLPSPWKKAFDRKEKIALIYQLDLRSSVPRIKKAVRVNCVEDGGCVLIPTVFVNDQQLAASFVRNVTGKENVTSMDDLSNLLEQVEDVNDPGIKTIFTSPYVEDVPVPKRLRKSGNASSGLPLAEPEVVDDNLHDDFPLYNSEFAMDGESHSSPEAEEGNDDESAVSEKNVDIGSKSEAVDCTENDKYYPDDSNDSDWTSSRTAARKKALRSKLERKKKDSLSGGEDEITSSASRMKDLIAGGKNAKPFRSSKPHKRQNIPKGRISCRGSLFRDELYWHSDKNSQAPLQHQTELVPGRKVFIYTHILEDLDRDYGPKATGYNLRSMLTYSSELMMHMADGADAVINLKLKYRDIGANSLLSSPDAVPAVARYLSEKFKLKETPARAILEAKLTNRCNSEFYKYLDSMK